MGLTSMILGILSFLISLGWFEDLSLILAVLGTVLGIIAIVKKQGKGMAIAGVILSILALIILFGGSDETAQSNSNNNIRKYDIEVYKNDKVDVKLVKIDDEYNEITFEVNNKTNETIGFALELIEVNEKTESPGYITEVLSKTTAESCTYVSATKDLEYLTAEFCVYDEDGSSIFSFDVKDVEIK